MSDIMRQSLNSFLPEGSLWQVQENSDLDKLLDGLADNDDAIRIFLAELANIRNPYKTLWLRDLEKDFGVSYNENLTEDERRMALAAIMYTRGNRGTKNNLQKALDKAGFTSLKVNTNDPAVDPSLFVSSHYLLVNGELWYGGVRYYYDVHVTPKSWNLVFFIGGLAIRDIYGYITSIPFVFININRVAEFKKLVLKYKPTHSWAGLRVLSEDPIFSGNHFSFISFDNMTSFEEGFSNFSNFDTKVGKMLNFDDIITV